MTIDSYPMKPYKAKIPKEIKSETTFLQEPSLSQKFSVKKGPKTLGTDFWVGLSGFGLFLILVCVK